jgi:hypothetical protein
MYSLSKLVASWICEDFKQKGNEKARKSRRGSRQRAVTKEFSRPQPNSFIESPLVTAQIYGNRK